MNASGFLTCFVVETCPRSYWVSTGAVIHIIAIKMLQSAKVSQEDVAMASAPHAGKLSTPSSLPTACPSNAVWICSFPLNDHSHGQDLHLIKPVLLVQASWPVVLLPLGSFLFSSPGAHIDCARQSPFGCKEHLPLEGGMSET